MWGGREAGRRLGCAQPSIHYPVKAQDFISAYPVKARLCFPGLKSISSICGPYIHIPSAELFALGSHFSGSDEQSIVQMGTRQTVKQRTGTTHGT
jgi:hypothetical protein